MADPLSAQPPEGLSDKEAFAEGTHALGAVLNSRKLQAIQTEEQFQKELDIRPEELLIISLGSQKYLNGIPYITRNFVNKGGAVLACTDEANTNGCFQTWGAIIDGDFVKVPEDSKYAYRKSGDCPFVQVKPVPEIPIFLGLDRIATNRPSYFLHSSTLLKILATLPNFDRDEVERNSPPLYFAAGGIKGQGRILVMADHSVFINRMMLPTDNDNLELAYNAIDWLTEDGKRTKVLFLENDKIVSNFNMQLKEPPLPPLPSEAELVQMINRTLVGLENENFFNRQIAKWINPAQLLRLLLIVLTMGLILYGWRKLAAVRYHLDTSIPLPEPRAVLAGTGPGVYQRHQALLHAGNLWESAHELARQFFEAALGVRPNPAGPTLPPTVTVTGDKRRGKTLERQVADLWHLACARTPSRFSFARYRRLAAQVRELRQALAEGTLRLAPPGP